MVHVTVYDKFGFYITWKAFNYMQQAVVFAGQYKEPAYKVEIK